MGVLGHPVRLDIVDKFQYLMEAPFERSSVTANCQRGAHLARTGGYVVRENLTGVQRTEEGPSTSYRRALSPQHSEQTTHRRKPRRYLQAFPNPTPLSYSQ